MEDQEFYGSRFGNYSLSPWIAEENSVMVYKFNLFCLDRNIDGKTLVKICDAIMKETREIYSKDYSNVAEIDIYDISNLSSLTENKGLFKGDRIPIFVGEFPKSDFLGMHMIQRNQTNKGVNSEGNNKENSEGFLAETGLSINETLGIKIADNFPEFTPWVAINSGEIIKRLRNGYWTGNPYAYNDVSDFYDVFSFTLSHEIHETLKDDTGQNWIIFDHNAPCYDNWHYLDLDEDGNCQNGIIDSKLNNNAYVYLPKLSELFSEGCQITVIEETCDPFSRLTFSKLQTYRVDGIAISNYATPNFWKTYYSNPTLKYDYKGFSQLPGQPYAGNIEPRAISFLDLKTNLSYYARVINYGPVTPQQRKTEMERESGPNWKAELNNFPPDYTVVTFV